MSYKTAALAAAGLLVLALAELPYGYYTFLRLVVCGAAVFGAFRAASSRAEGWALLLGALALLFNPVAPVHLDRGAWAVLDLFTAAIFAASTLRLRDSGAAERPD